MKHGVIDPYVLLLLLSGTLMSGLSLLFLMSVMNMFFGSVMLFKVAEPRLAKRVISCVSRRAACIVSES